MGEQIIGRLDNLGRGMMKNIRINYACRYSLFFTNRRIMLVCAMNDDIENQFMAPQADEGRHAMRNAYIFMTINPLFGGYNRATAESDTRKRRGEFRKIMEDSFSKMTVPELHELCAYSFSYSFSYSEIKQITLKKYSWSPSSGKLTIDFKKSQAKPLSFSLTGDSQFGLAKEWNRKLSTFAPEVIEKMPLLREILVVK